LPSQLAYPDILETHRASRKTGVPVAEKEEVEDEDITRTWYPPLTSALSLMSKLYGVVDKSVFEDFARRIVDELVVALRKAADGVKRKNSILHGDLFLIRHILILRE
jgi:hypothetical protein